MSERNESLVLTEEIKKYKTTELISFLKGQNLELDEENLKIIRKQKLTAVTSPS